MDVEGDSLILFRALPAGNSEPTGFVHVRVEEVDGAARVTGEDRLDELVVLTGYIAAGDEIVTHRQVLVTLRPVEQLG